MKIELFFNYVEAYWINLCIFFFLVFFMIRFCCLYICGYVIEIIGRYRDLVCGYDFISIKF